MILLIPVQGKTTNLHPNLAGVRTTVITTRSQVYTTNNTSLYMSAIYASLSNLWSWKMCRK